MTTTFAATQSTATQTTNTTTASITPDSGLLAIRLMIGWVFIFHGSQKLFAWFGGGGIDGTAQFMNNLGIPLPTLSALAAGGTEFVGGLALLTGLFLRWVSAPLAFTMLVAAFTAHWGAFAVTAGGMEYPLTLAVIVAGLGLIGPGRFTAASLWQK